jgi:hypothetical protein
MCSFNPGASASCFFLIIEMESASEMLCSISRTEFGSFFYLMTKIELSSEMCFLKQMQDSGKYPTSITSLNLCWWHECLCVMFLKIFLQHFVRCFKNHADEATKQKFLERRIVNVIVGF